MTLQPLLPDVLKELVEAMVFPVSYTTATDNTDGTYTLGGICNIFHAQPGFKITIDGNEYEIKDYGTDDDGYALLLKAGSNPLPAAPNTFNLYIPFFFHGHPIQQNVELKDKMPEDKTPMIYFMEPYDTVKDASWDSSIDSRSTVVLCFLTQAKTHEWETKDFYYHCIKPMNALMEKFIEVIKTSNKFYTEEMVYKPAYHSKFGINIRELGTKKEYFAELLSGCSVQLFLQMYKIESCDCVPGTDAMPSAACSGGVFSSAPGEQIDQTAGGGSYGVLAGDVDDANTLFTVSLNRYRSGSLSVYLNGQLIAQGVSWTETNPATGKFTMVTAPSTGDIITAIYRP